MLTRPEYREAWAGKTIVGDSRGLSGVLYTSRETCNYTLDINTWPYLALSLSISLSLSLTWRVLQEFFTCPVKLDGN